MRPKFSQGSPVAYPARSVVRTSKTQQALSRWHTGPGRQRRGRPKFAKGRDAASIGRREWKGTGFPRKNATEVFPGISGRLPGSLCCQDLKNTTGPLQVAHWAWAATPRPAEVR